MKEKIIKKEECIHLGGERHCDAVCPQLQWLNPEPLDLESSAVATRPSQQKSVWKKD